jgi:hypothetical protein
MRKLIGLLSVVALLAGVPVAAQKTNSEAAMMRSLGAPGLTGDKLVAAIEKARAFPLGSKDNPVRANGPGGQRAYLERLRCDEGKKPTYTRAGNVGEGVYGYIVDDYRVKCPGLTEVTIYMDLYHDWVEDQAVPGFTILPAKDAA